MNPPTIILEGGDNSGKSSVAEALSAVLTRLGVRSLRITEPGSSPLGCKLRAMMLDGEVKDPWTVALLMQAARQESTRLIDTALGEGYPVIMDRSYLSTLVYQGIELGREKMAALTGMGLDRFSRWDSLDYPKTFVFLYGPPRERPQDALEALHHPGLVEAAYRDIEAICREESRKHFTQNFNIISLDRREHNLSPEQIAIGIIAATPALAAYVGEPQAVRAQA